MFKFLSKLIFKPISTKQIVENHFIEGGYVTTNYRNGLVDFEIKKIELLKQYDNKLVMIIILDNRPSFAVIDYHEDESDSDYIRIIENLESQLVKNYYKPDINVLNDYEEVKEKYEESSRYITDYPEIETSIFRWISHGEGDYIKKLKSIIDSNDYFHEDHFVTNYVKIHEFYSWNKEEINTIIKLRTDYSFEELLVDEEAFYVIKDFIYGFEENKDLHFENARKLFEDGINYVVWYACIEVVYEMYFDLTDN